MCLLTVVLALFGAEAAQAQTSVKLVSNTGQTVQSGTSINVGFSGVNRWLISQNFTTGRSPRGFTLSAVDVRLNAIGSSAAVRVSIYSTTSSGAPSSSLHVLTNPAPVHANTINKFTAPQDAKLNENTTYAVVIEEVSGGTTNAYGISLPVTASNGEDSGAADGWSIADNAVSRQEGQGGWSWRHNVKSFIAIYGNAVPEISSATVNGTALEIRFDKSLDTASAPAGSAFTVTAMSAGGTLREIDGKGAAVTISGAIVGVTDTVSVTLASAVAERETVTVGYAKPAIRPLRHADGAVPSFSDAPVRNVTVDEVTSTPTVGALVSNTGQARAPSSNIFERFDRDRAQQFRTGGNPQGYTLTRVDLIIRHNSGTLPGYSVSIRSGSQTGTNLGTLSNPVTLPSTIGPARFDAPSGGIQLAANTNYWVLLDVTSASDNTRLKRTTLNSEDAGAATGWSIADSSLNSTGVNGSIWSTHSNARQLAIHGSTNPAPPVFSSATVDGDTLEVTFDKSLSATAASNLFTVTATPEGGEARTITGASARTSGAKVRETLTSAVKRGETVTVSYAKPSLAPLQDPDGNEVASFDDQPVTNGTTTGARPVIQQVRIVSWPTYDTHPVSENDTYLRGDEILIDVEFSEQVEVTGDGDVRLRLDLGADDTTQGNSRKLVKSPQVLHNGRTLRFSYTVTSTDTDTDGVWVQTDAANNVVLDPHTTDKVVSAATGARAFLALDGLPTAGDPLHMVNGPKTSSNDVGPRVTSASVSGATLTLHFDKRLSTGGFAGLEPDFSVQGAGGVDGNHRGVNQHPTTVVRSSNTSVTLTLGVAARAGETVTLSYGGKGLRAIPSDGGRAAPMFRDMAVTNNTPGAAGPSPLQASVAVKALRVVFDGALDATSAPAGSAFRVGTLDLNGDARAIAGTGTAAVSGTVVTVALAAAVREDEVSTATVTYTKPDRNWLRGAGTGNPAVLSFDRVRIETVDEGEPPRLVDGAVSRTAAASAESKVVLSFNEALDESSEPAAGDFAVTVASATETVSDVAVGGSNVVLTLGTAVSTGDTVVVAYTPGTNPIRDVAGNAAAAFTKTLTAGSVKEPALDTANPPEVNGARVVLTYDAPLDPGSVPAPEAFTLHHPLFTYEDDEGNTVSERSAYQGRRVVAVGVEGQTVVLHLDHPVFPCTAAFTVTYTKPAASALRHFDASKEADGFEYQGVTSPRADDDCSTGWVQRAEVGSIVLTAARPFATDAAPQAAWFTVTASGGPVTVTGAAFSPDGARKLKLTLSRDIAPGETVTVSYTRPPRERGLWDVGGNQLADIVDLPVENDAPVSLTAPAAPTVAKESDTSVTVSWTAPDAAAVTGYGVRYRRRGAADWTSHAHTGTGTSATISGLAAGRSHEAQVRAKSAGGAGPWSDSGWGHTGPARLESAATEEAGRGLILAFTKEILTAGPHTDYTVVVDGERRTTRSAFWEDNTVGLVLAEPVRWGETVTVAYAKPSGGTILHDADNLAIESFGPETVTNTLPPNQPATGAPAIAGAARVGETLTASTAGIEDADGLSGAAFAFQWLSGEADVAGATDASYTLADSDVGAAIRVRVTFTDDAGNEETVTSAPTGRVEARPLTAEFQGMPAEHDGSRLFSFELVFSENFPGRFPYTTLRDSAFTVTGGSVRAAERVVKSENRRWKIGVRPSSNDDVTITLPAGSVSTESGRPLSNSPSARVIGPVGVSVADARVEEGAGAVLAFAVTLSRAATSALTVDYATSDGSARAGEDYTAASGTLSFQAGDSSGTIEVAVLDDAHDEGEETLTLTLSNASGAVVTDGEATGTIENADLMPAALLARIGRATAEQVVEHVEERMAAPRRRGFRARFAGREFQPGMEREFALGFLSSFAPMGMGQAGAAPMHGDATGAAPMAMGSHAAGPGAFGAGTAGMGGMGGGAMSVTGMGGMAGAMGMAGQQAPTAGTAAMAGHGPGGAAQGGGLFGAMGLGGGLFSDSEFELNRESRGGILSFWSRSSRSHFSGMEDALSLDGDVRTTMVGGDYARGPLTVGLSVGRTLGLGGYRGPSGGRMSTSMTGFYPWVGYQVNERVSVWGVTGYGTGALSLTPDGQSALETGVSMAMSAVGTRGELVGSRATGGFALAFKADALWVGAASDLLDGAAGRLNASEAGVTRVRTALEGSRGFTLGGRLSLTPSVEVGLRRDGGDAETGAGMDVGGGLAFSDRVTGLSLDVRVRTLVVHQADGFSERGMSLSLGWDPTPSSPLGLTAKVAPSWGGQARGGAEALWGNQMAYGMGSRQMYGSGERVDAEVGYGLPVGARLVGTPRVGLTTSPYGRDYRFGYGLGVLEQGKVSFELTAEAQRRESATAGEVSNGVMGRATLGW